MLVKTFLVSGLTSLSISVASLPTAQIDAAGERSIFFDIPTPAAGPCDIKTGQDNAE